MACVIALFDIHNQGQTQRVKTYLQKNQWQQKLQRSAATIAKWGMAMNLAFGVGGFVQDRKKQRQMDNIEYLQKLRIAQLEADLKKQEEQA